MGRVTHFEVTADDPVRAAKFYSDVFDWDIKKWNGPMDYWLVATGKKVTGAKKAKEDPGIDGAIMRRAYAQAVIHTIDVADLDEAMEAVKEAGGEIVNEPHEIPGVGRTVYAKDTEGNVFGMIQGDPTATV